MQSGERRSLQNKETLDRVIDHFFREIYRTCAFLAILAIFLLDVWIQLSTGLIKGIDELGEDYEDSSFCTEATY